MTYVALAGIQLKTALLRLNGLPELKIRVCGYLTSGGIFSKNAFKGEFPEYGVLAFVRAKEDQLILNNKLTLTILRQQ